MSTALKVSPLREVAGKVDVPGAPILNFCVLVDSATGRLHGHAQIQQSVPPPEGVLRIDNLTGKVATLVFNGKTTKAIHMRGSYTPNPIQPLSLGFEAHFVTDADGVGTGSFEYGPHDVKNVPIRPDDEPAPGNGG